VETGCNLHPVSTPTEAGLQDCWYHGTLGTVDIQTNNRNKKSMKYVINMLLKIILFNLKKLQNWIFVFVTFRITSAAEQAASLLKIHLKRHFSLEKCIMDQLN
jgi:hypothetical protein